MSYKLTGNIYSQFGEDKIIENIFSIIKPTDKTCVEFGAWDGIHFSNTANLWKRKEWKTILIESDLERFEELQENTKGYKTTNINEKVTIENINSLLTEDYDLVSIDVDGDDWYLLNAMRIKPKVIICEYNPTIPHWIPFVQKQGDDFGSSVLSIQMQCEEREYRLIAITDTNAIFVRGDYKHLFKDWKPEYKMNYITYVFGSYSGNYILSIYPVYGFKERVKQ